MNSIRTISATTVLWFCLSALHAQTNLEETITDLTKIEQLEIERNPKIDAAFEAMETVKKANHYIQSLTGLFENGEISLPVGIKNGDNSDYELMIQKINFNENTGKHSIYATCAFKFKDTGQRIAFEGWTELRGERGMGTSGGLTLITPVRRNIGKHAVLIVQEGTCVRFGCNGVKDVAARLTWMITSPYIIPVDKNGQETKQSIVSHFETYFANFDNYVVSLNIDQFFKFKGLESIIFSIGGASLDQSDTETPAMISFPDGYLTPGDEFKLWKGVYISETSISLPSIFKHPVSGERITLSLKNVLFDENGFTGKVAAYDVFSSKLLDPKKWDVSINDFTLELLKNELIAAGFGGEINIPPFGKNSLFPYMAEYNQAAEEFDFRANIGGTYDFPVLHSTLLLHETSTLDIALRDGDVHPTINANGVLSINAPVNEKDTTKKFSIPDIVVENLQISRDAPYMKIGAIGLSGELRPPKVAGFELVIKDIKSFEHSSESGLSFNTVITLNEMFGGEAGILLYGDYAHWKFDRVGIDKVHVDYKSQAFSISGGVEFKNGDAVYGDGFRGDVSFNLIEKFKLDAVAVFGKKDDYKYFLADAFFEMTPPMGITIPPALTFYGFGGGLYRKMQQTSDTPGSDFGKALSGINYIPDKTVSMGVMTSTKFALTASDKAFNAKVGFEIQFNSSGGLNFIQLRGDASIMDMPAKWGKMVDNVTQQMKKLEDSGGKLKIAQKTDLKTPENKDGGFLTASLNIKYDLINRTFNADMNAYLNAGGVIVGVGENDRLGWASAYFGPDKWYAYMGTPTDRMGIRLLNLATADGYFMLGADIPALPPPPSKVLNMLSAEKQQKLTRNNSGELNSGKGIAFGSSFNVNFNAEFTPFYASIGAGMGSEFLLTDWKGRGCSNLSYTPGINGWYAEAQAWAYIQAAIGMEAKIFKKTKKFEILDISTGALLEGKGPNPIYLAGSVGGSYSVLGGLIKGKCAFDFEIGEACIPARTGSPFGEDIIAQITPDAGASEVNVFAAPQAIFNVPVEKEMMIDDEGNKVAYKVNLVSFTVKNKATGAELIGRRETSADGTVSLLDPEEPFDSRKDFTVYVKVGLQQKLSGKWQAVNGDDGKPLFEEKEATFTSGDRPKEIMPEHVKYSYPIARQYNFYPDEYKAGYIHVTENYAYLFSTEKPEGFKQILRIGDLSGKNFETPFTYTTNSSGNTIRLEINFSTVGMDFAGNKIYKMAIVNVPQTVNASVKSNVTEQTEKLDEDTEIHRQEAEGELNLLAEKEIYALNFKTSKYKTFGEKIAKIDTRAEGWRDVIEPEVHHIKTNLKLDELFDKYEIQWDANVMPLVRFEAQIDRTDWYNNSFYKNMYANAYRQAIRTNRENQDPRAFGEPPVAAVLIAANKIQSLTDAEITTNYPAGYNFQSVFTYALPYWCFRDYYYMRSLLAEKRLGGSITSEELALLNKSGPPVVEKGNYPVQIKYVLPCKDLTTSVVNIEMYNPVE
jgi:hypothetical protein